MDTFERRLNCGPKVRVLVSGVATTIVALACSSCSPAATGSPGLDSKGAYAEYLKERSALALPPSATWPAPTFPTDTVYGVGSGKVKADDDWICAWEKVYVMSTGVNRAEALKQLDKIKGLPGYLLSDSSYKTGTDQMLSKAHLGDPSMISQDYQANCA